MQVISLFLFNEIFQFAGNSDELKSLLSNRHLREMLGNLNSSESPNVDMDAAMKEPMFVEFVEQCLRVVERTGEHS